MRGDVANMPPLPRVFRDYFAPTVRNALDGRELVMARWDMPSPRSVIEGRMSDLGVTNIRNVSSPDWRALAWRRGSLRRTVLIVLRE